MAADILRIQERIRGEALAPFNLPPTVRQVSTDTRMIQKGDVFFALSGKRFDGHDFIAEAIEKGARHFVASDRKKVKAEWLRRANGILVPDVLTAYGDLARNHRLGFKVPVIVITGSSGKTTVKELTAHLLSAKFRVLKNRGTENNLVGVPKTLLQLDETHEVVVLELGTNAPGEIERLSFIAGAQIGVLTQIGHGHLELLKSLEGVFEEKTKLLKNLERGGTLVVNGEDPMLAGLQSGVHRIQRVGLGARPDSAWADRAAANENGTRFFLNGKDPVETQLLGRHNIINTLLAIQVAQDLGVALDAIQKGCASFRNVPGRLSLKVLDGKVFIDDTYNANPTSFRAALETLKSFQTKGRKALICGDMLELGDASQALHESCGEAAGRMGLDLLIATGPMSAHLAAKAVESGLDASKVQYAKNSEEAGRIAGRWTQAGDTVLVKGSRGMQMERVFDCFTSCSTP